MHISSTENYYFLGKPVELVNKLLITISSLARYFAHLSQLTNLNRIESQAPRLSQPRSGVHFGLRFQTVTYAHHLMLF